MLTSPPKDEAELLAQSTLKQEKEQTKMVDSFLPAVCIVNEGATPVLLLWPFMNPTAVYSSYLGFPSLRVALIPLRCDVGSSHINPRFALQ